MYDFFAVVALCRFLVAIEFSIINIYYILLQTQKKTRPLHFAPCPENAKTFFLEMRNLDFGTSIRAKISTLHPPKTRKPFSGKQETSILGHHVPHLAPFWNHGLKLANSIFENLAAFMVL